MADIVVGAPDQDVVREDQGGGFVFFSPFSPGQNPPYASYKYLEVKPGEENPPNEPGNRFGFSVAIGEFTPVGLASPGDVVLGCPYALGFDQGGQPVSEAGAVDVFVDVTLFSLPYRDYHLQQPTSWGPAAVQAQSHYGWSVAIGQFADPAIGETTSDLRDLAIGAPDIDMSLFVAGGLVYYHWGYVASGKPTYDNNPTHMYRTEGARLGGRIGAALAAGHYDIDLELEDPWDDIAIGSPGSQFLPEDSYGGWVIVARGSQNGLIGGDEYPWWIWAPVEPEDFRSRTNEFGASLAWADTDNDGLVDLVVGTPGVVVLGGQPGGVAFVLHGHEGQRNVPAAWTSEGQYTVLYDPTPNYLERFAESVGRTWRLGTARDDVVVGAPLSDIPGVPDAGEVYVWNY
ncbi:MAG: hypothetical protein AB1486_10290 [Planctomycetota bacterium]